MKQFSLLIKPASADCNLHCPYCFYLDRSALYPESKRHRMPDKILAQMISSYMKTMMEKEVVIGRIAITAFPYLKIKAGKRILGFRKEISYSVTGRQISLV